MVARYNTIGMESSAELPLVPSPGRACSQEEASSNDPRRQLPFQLPGVYPWVFIRVFKQVADEDVEGLAVVHDGRHT